MPPQHRIAALAAAAQEYRALTAAVQRLTERNPQGLRLPRFLASLCPPAGRP